MSTTVFGAGASFQGVAGIADSAGTVRAGTVVFSNSNNVTFGLNGSTVTASASGGGGGGVAVSAGTQSGNTGTVVFANSNGISFGMSGSSQITAQAGPVLSFWDNMVPTVTGNTLSNQAFGTMFLCELDPVRKIFPGNMTASTMLWDASAASPGATNGMTVTLAVGIYTISGSNTLNMLNSISTTLGYTGASDSGNTYWNGARFLSFHSSQWSASPTFTRGGQYYVGYLLQTSGTSLGFSYYGLFREMTNQRSGTAGVVPTTSASMAQVPYVGAYSVDLSNTGVLPASVNMTDFNRTLQAGAFVPRIVFNNQLSAF